MKYLAARIKAIYRRYQGLFMEFTQPTEEIDLQKYWLVLKRRWVPAVGVFGTFVVLGAVTASMQKYVYSVEGKLLVKKEQSSELTGLKNDIGEIVPIGEKTNPLATEAQIISSYPIAEETVRALALKDEKGKPLDPKVLAAKLQVKPLTGTDLLQISYEDHDPKIAAAVVNKTMEVYIQNNILNNRSQAAAARVFIDKQLPAVEATVKQADAALRQFKEENRVVSLEDEATASVRVVSDLDTQITQAQTKLAEATARSTKLRNQLGLTVEESVAVNSLSQNNALQETIKDLQKVQTKLATERGRFLDADPRVESLRNQEANLKILLQKQSNQILGTQRVPVKSLQIGTLKEKLVADLVQAEVDRASLAKQLTVLSEQQSAYKKRSNVMPRLQQTQRELERRVKASQTTYETLLNKLQEAQVSENQNVGNARIISKGIAPEKPTGPGKTKNLAAGAAVGLLLGVATAFLLDLIDRNVKTVKEARGLFGYTLLGVIPAFGKPGKIRSQGGDTELDVPKVVVKEMPRSPLCEAYQMLQANLKFLSSDKQIKAIVVTSSVPKEGKSEVSANLAAAMAQVGRRVLLVDADMRHPSQHHIWNLTNYMGLSNVLVGEVDFNTVVQEVMPGLDILTSGVIPPNPVALLDSQRMATLIEVFSNNYDYVIFDTPSLAGIADAPILGKMADGILLVVRPKVVDFASANAAKEFLMRSGQNVLGLVANGVIIKNEPDSYFYYAKEEDVAKQEQNILSFGRYSKRS